MKNKEDIRLSCILKLLKKKFLQSNAILAMFLCLSFVGCGSTRAFMGSYDMVKIDVYGDHAKMSAENIPFDAKFNKGKLVKKNNLETVFDLNDSSQSEDKDIKGNLRVHIICSEKNLRKEISDKCFQEDGVSFKEPDKKSIIAEVIVYPKKKAHDDSGGMYHEILFKTRGEFAVGTHRVFVKDPIAFTFWPTNIKDATKNITMIITHSGVIEDCKFVVKDGAVLPINVQLQLVSEIISTIKKPIKIIFTIK